MIQVGDQVWVNEKGPCNLWGRSDLVVKEVIGEDKVKIWKQRDAQRKPSVYYAWTLTLEQIDKQ